MDEIIVKRIDHLGIVAGVIKDLKIIEQLDEQLRQDERNKISAGEAVAGMILNSLGFINKPLSLTPQFFESKALELLFRSGVEADDFNRHKLGKVLDKVYEAGVETLFYAIAARCCREEGINLQFLSGDTTSFSLTGDYLADSDEQVVQITHGHSKDHRPDLKQVVQELLVSQDGGVPLMLKSWEGNASDSTIFKERAKQLIEHFKACDAPSYLVADSKLYSKPNQANLAQLNFITRIPGSLRAEAEIIEATLEKNQWESLNTHTRYAVHTLTHYDIPQRWIVVSSEQAKSRAQKSLDKAAQKEALTLKKQLWHLSLQPYACEQDAYQAIQTLQKKVRYHQFTSVSLTSKPLYAKAGRPKKSSQPSGCQHFVSVHYQPDDTRIQAALHHRACYVIGTNVPPSQLSDQAVIHAYKQQNTAIENTGFRFLKDPLFFANSFFLKKPSRIMALLMVMTLALLVYSVAQRRLRRALQQQQQTLPNQINQPTQTPTLRWIFQLMEGIHFLTVRTKQAISHSVQGLTPLRQSIIRLFGPTIMAIYGLIHNPLFLAPP